MTMLRPAAVAGRFYPGDPAELRRAVQEYAGGAADKSPAIACIVPHAGYIYSGAVAGQVYRSLKIPRRVLLLGPRHFPRGEALAILSEGAWKTPLGDAKIDERLAAEIKRAFPLLREDEVAHSAEHSLEVQLPFLQTLCGDFEFVPVVLGTDRLETLEALGSAIAKVVAAQRDPVLIVTSSDMNHYENDAITRVKDRLAIDKILALDPRGLHEVVREKGISMCGYAPTVAMLVAARELGAKRAELIAYSTSAEVSGDRDWVVGYAGVIVS
ncbi:MAG TPA: AmmeMemoRadiSam system protein B [Candidatus Acidoferrales bacterium]|nr:AmmeMemoRadiSam system protein B [Candidatus Acidoferrales bacterium]